MEDATTGGAVGDYERLIMRKISCWVLLLSVLFCLPAGHTPAVEMPEAPPAVPAVAAHDTDTPIEVNRRSFRRELVKASRAAAREGTITHREALRVRIASHSPAFLEAAEELCIIQMVFSGENSDDIPRTETGDVDRTAIDWEAFGAFLQAILPLILELLLALGVGAA